jgi:lipoate-protein ligase B
MHGLALNRDPDLGWFETMTACAAPDTPATSIAAEGGNRRRERVERDLAAALAVGLSLALEPTALEDVLPMGAGRS